MTGRPEERMQTGKVALRDGRCAALLQGSTGRLRLTPRAARPGAREAGRKRVEPPGRISAGAGAVGLRMQERSGNVGAQLVVDVIALAWMPLAVRALADG